MEPQLPSPSQTPENGPAHFRGGEVFPAVNKPEKTPEQPEKQETREQHVGGPSEPAPVVKPVAPALPPLPSAQPAQPAQTTDDNGTNPAVAGDEDLIEKEWVEKAKKVVAETRHDPYLQGREVSKLQADYLKKRYGKIVNLPAEGA